MDISHGLAGMEAKDIHFVHGWAGSLDAQHLHSFLEILGEFEAVVDQLHYQVFGRHLVIHDGFRHDEGMDRSGCGVPVVPAIVPADENVVAGIEPGPEFCALAR